MKCSSPLLDRAKAGMKIYLTDKDKVYTYSITSVENVEPERVDVVDDATDGTAEVTLVTCEDLSAQLLVQLLRVF